MKIDSFLSETGSKLQKNIENFVNSTSNSEFSYEISENFISMITQTIQEIGANAIKNYFESKDIEKEYIIERDRKYRFKYKSKKEIMTPIGKVEFNRSVYQQDKGGKSIIPLDRILKVENEYVTLSVKDSVMYTCAHMTPRETSDLLAKCSLIRLHSTTVSNILEQCSQVIEQHKEQINKNLLNKLEVTENVDVIVGSIDGVNLKIREEGVNKGRPKERPTSEEKTECATSYKNAMCGTISFYTTEQSTNEKLVSHRISTNYTAQMPEDKSVIFKEEFEKKISKINQATIDKNVVKIMLCDGFRAIWKYLESNELYKDYEFLIDFYHASEHLSKLAELLFGKKNENAQKWYNTYREKLKNEENGLNSLINSISYLQKKQKISKSVEKEIEREKKYFQKNRSKMNYYRFKNRGLPIGSGVVEAACKSVVKQRMCRSGMIWSIEGGNKILYLRSIVKSNNWKTFFDEFKKSA
jgi:hypothetical protein